MVKRKLNEKLDKSEILEAFEKFQAETKEESAKDNDEWDVEPESDLDSDKELQLAFEQGLLKPGLNVELSPPDTTIYNKVEMLRLVEELREQNLDWIERMDITCEPLPSDECVPNQEILDVIQSNDFVNDDFKRELQFFCQAQAAIKIGLPKLAEEGIRTERPQDYFAEMAKSDEHMKKVRERLQAKTKTAERVEKIRKLREAKKIGKKVQIEREKAKVAEKKAILRKVDEVKKGKSKDLSFLDDDFDTGGDVGDSVMTKKNSHTAKKHLQTVKKKNKLRMAKDLKYGFGGKKRHKNRNDKASAAAFDYGDPKQKKKTIGSKRSKGSSRPKQRAPKGKGKRK